MAKKILGIDSTDHSKSLDLGIEVNENYETVLTIPVRINDTNNVNVIANFDCPVRVNDWMRLGYTAYGAHNMGYQSGDINADVTVNYNSVDTRYGEATYVAVPSGQHEGQSIIIQHFNQQDTGIEWLRIYSVHADGWVEIELSSTTVTSEYCRLIWINNQWRILYTNGDVVY